MDFSSRKQNVRDSKECWSIAKGKTIQGKKKRKEKAFEMYKYSC